MRRAVLLESLLQATTSFERLAIAGRSRPWPREAIDQVTAIGCERGWDARDLEVLAKVMADEAPQLTRPLGIDDGRRWSISCGESWNWTLWQSDDGMLALEVLKAGWAYDTATVLLDEAQRRAVAAHGVSALAEMIATMRDSS